MNIGRGEIHWLRQRLLNTIKQRVTRPTRPTQGTIHQQTHHTPIDGSLRARYRQNGWVLLRHKGTALPRFSLPTLRYV
jgi:hypothetical protein